jgi:hypothetical protein
MRFPSAIQTGLFLSFLKTAACFWLISGATMRFIDPYLPHVPLIAVQPDSLPACPVKGLDFQWTQNV